MKGFVVKKIGQSIAVRISENSGNVLTLVRVHIDLCWHVTRYRYSYLYDLNLTRIHYINPSNRIPVLNVIISGLII
jgi:hypothetical protein